MRFTVLALSMALPLVTEGRAQETPDMANAAAGKAAAPLVMPTPKPSARGCGLLYLACPHPRNEKRDLRLQPLTAARRERVADKKFWLAAGGAMGTSLLLVAGTSHCRRTVGVESCMGGYGDFKAIQGVQIGLSGAMIAVGYGLKRSDQKSGAKHSQWWLFPVGVTALNGFRAIYQFSKHCPRGTVFNGDDCK